MEIKVIRDADDIVNNMSDQHYMMERINKLNIRRISIHKHIFLNGVYPNLNTTASLVLPETASLIHFNCMIGSEKEYNMKLKGMWYI